jgi:hypothetical protein
MVSNTPVKLSSVQAKDDNEADATMYVADAAPVDNATASGLARVETDGVEMFEAEEPADESMEEAAVADAVPMRELTLSVDSIDDACGYIMDLVAEYEGTVDEQRFAEDDGSGVNLFIEIPAENAPEFLSAAAHYGNASADAESMDLPADGMLLAPTAFPIAAKDTVYTLLTDAAQSCGLRLDVTGGAGTRYVRGINGLYEFDHGDLSGWLYLVNGESPSEGCDQYRVQDGDVVEWRYTTDMGRSEP